jgi:vitamin B12 transporter
MKRTYLLASCALAAVATNPAFADQVIDLGEITVSANEDATTLERSGTTVEVLTSEALNVAPGPRLSDALTGLPGVSASSNGGLGTSTHLRIRGLGGAYVPVFYDGINISDPASSGNGFDWGGITGANISRVEVLKGSQSARYGSSAVGGVVTLQSWTPTTQGVSGQGFAEFGTYNTARAGLSVGLLTDRTELSMGVSRVTTDGFSANAAGTEADGYSENRANLKLSYQLTDMALVGFTAFYLDSDGQFDERGGDGAVPYDEENARTQKGARLYSEFMTGAVSHDLSFSYFETDRSSTSNGWATPFFGTRKTAEYKAGFDLGRTVAMTTGADFTREEASGSSAETVGYFAEAAFTPSGALDIVASVRRDDLSNFADKTTGRLTLAWRITNDVIVRAQAATGYNPPTLYQLTSVYGSPTFQPEESKSFELGVEKRYGGSNFVRATAFKTDIDGQVFWDRTSVRCASGFGCYEVQDFTAQGLELSGQVAVADNVDLLGSFTWTDTEDGNGNQALRVPLHDLEIGLQATLSAKTKGSVSLNHVSGRVDTIGAVPDYTLLNANVSHQLTDTTEAYLRLENLTDENYETAAGYATSGRAVYFGVRASF